eukprot:COSAG01_NODE_3792_length_5691_cov_11.941166_6_plen_114_part_00
MYVQDYTGEIARAVNATLAPMLAPAGVQIWAGEIGPHNGGSPGCIRGGRWSNWGNTFCELVQYCYSCISQWQCSALCDLLRIMMGAGAQGILMRWQAKPQMATRYSAGKISSE